MKKLSEIIKELGFDPNKPQGAQKAFIKSLIKEAGQQSPRTNEFQEQKNILPLEKQVVNKRNTSEQLAFDLGSVDHINKNKIS